MRIIWEILKNRHVWMSRKYGLRRSGLGPLTVLLIILACVLVFTEKYTRIGLWILGLVVVYNIAWIVCVHHHSLNNDD